MRHFRLLFLLCISIPAFAQHFETKILRNAANGKISQYETIEIGMRFPQQERLYRNFLSDHSTGINPYSHNQIRMQFVCNGKTYTVPAFYMEDAQADAKANKYISYQAEWPWRVRFAVPDTGKWECIVLIGETKEKSVPMSTSIRFNCMKGKQHGFLRIAENKRRFEYADGTPFFAIGQNIAWADEPVLHGKAGPHPVYSAGYYDMLHYIDDLAACGGNYVRIVMICWSTGIEWEETGVYMQDRAWALDTIMRLAEARGIKVHLCLDLTTGFAKDNGKDFWHPYRKSFQKNGMTAADLLRDSSALKAFDNYVRYVHARWAFSPVVSTIELLGEEQRWEGYEGREKYFDDFFKRMDKLLRNELEDPWHFLSTSLSESNYSDHCKNPAISFIDIHQYTNDFVMNQRRFKIVNSRTVDKIDKPFLFGEMGIITGPVNACDPDDWDYCNDITMHNSIWATTFMGGAGTGLYWWQWKNDAYRKANYVSLSSFINSTAEQLNGFDDNRMFTGNGLEAFYAVKSASKTKAVGWVHNRSNWWGNMTDSCFDRNRKQMIHPKDEDKATKPEDRSGNAFSIGGLLRSENYRIDFYDTRSAGKKVGTVNVKSNALGKVQLKFPKGAEDFAFVVEKI